MRWAAVILGLVLSLPFAQSARACDAVEFDGARFTVCELDMRQDDLRLFLRDPSGAVFGTFENVDASLPPGRRLGLAMNAGMFHDDRAPVGLYVEEREQEMRLITSDGPGNFGLLPNGVFCIEDGAARVQESLRFEAASPDCRFATQSGPMLVIEGELHPRFRESSDSLNIRNGVGVDASGQRVVLAISDERVNFHHFGRLFRDHLSLPNALYFDGRVSRLYAPDIGRTDLGFPLGPIIGTIVDVGVDAGPGDG